MIDRAIKNLVQYGRKTGLLEPEDEIYARNRILAVLGKDGYEEPDGPSGDPCLEEILKELLDYAAEQGLLEHNSVVYRDLFDAKLMDCLMPRPSEVKKTFWSHYAGLLWSLYLLYYPVSAAERRGLSRQQSAGDGGTVYPDCSGCVWK